MSYTQSTVLGNCPFLAYALIKPRPDDLIGKKLTVDLKHYPNLYTLKLIEK